MNFKQLTIFHNFNQKLLAQKLNLTQQCISSWFCGRTTPNIQTMEKIKNTLNCSYDDLVISLLESQKKNGKGEFNNEKN